MIVYADASALVKRYVREEGSEAFGACVAEADLVGTGIISRTEVIAALGRAARREFIPLAEATRARDLFEKEWNSLVRLPIHEPLAARAGRVAWDMGLRGYDAMHLATALSWRDTLDSEITLATYDRELWQGARKTGLTPWPAVL